MKFYAGVYGYLDKRPPWPDNVYDDRVRDLLAEDWARDIGHDDAVDAMTYAQFSRSLFEALDQWTDSVDVDAYAALAASLLPLARK